ncbi:MAG: gluconate 2-dehydrogenase subunit 3 family protein [Sphingomicrobium sp.]
MDELYPGYDVLDKWRSPSFDDITRTVVADRLDNIPERRFLTASEWTLLEALAERLVPHKPRSPVAIVPWIDDALANGKIASFRRSGDPQDQQIWRDGLAAIDREARRRHGGDFAMLDAEAGEMLLQDIKGGAVSDGWSGVAPKRFLIDILLREMVAVYYSHLQGWNAIGFGGPASPRGYVRTQLGGRDPWEAKEK